ncbi:MAG TPA: TraB/GumN family protein, partial [Polyangiaceae bacterium]|nr:TraB/GumN family protein [Polyangiaceae bacterium]
FRPWFVALTLTTQSLEREGFSAEHGIDEHFRRAAAGHKRIEALETVDGQLSLFASLSADAEEQLLRQTLEEVDAYAGELDAAFRLWSSGDASGIDQLLVASMQGEYPDLFQRLFTDRNRAMTERLIELARVPGHYFVVVGAGHLVGKTGILSLLASRGIVSQQL